MSAILRKLDLSFRAPAGFGSCGGCMGVHPQQLTNLASSERCGWPLCVQRQLRRRMNLRRSAGPSHETGCNVVRHTRADWTQFMHALTTVLALQLLLQSSYAGMAVPEPPPAAPSPAAAMSRSPGDSDRPSPCLSARSDCTAAGATPAPTSSVSATGDAGGASPGDASAGRAKGDPGGGVAVLKRRSPSTRLCS